MQLNAFFVIIVAALALEYVLSMSAKLLNLKALEPKPPEALDDIYDAGEYRRSQEYTRAKTRFELASKSFSLALLLAFWFLGGFNLLDEAVRGLEYPSIVDGLLFIGVLGIGYMIVSLPFDVYSTFIIEERFGFNRTGPRTFVADRVKGLLLTIVLGGALLAVVLTLFEYGGSLAWLYCWAAVSGITVVLEFVAPTWIMPLFSKFTPLEAGDLRDRIFEYARSVSFKVGDIYVVDGSKRSTKANAFFTGFGSRKRIALFDTLVEKHTVPELVSVLAHEIGHYKKRHILHRMALGVAHTGVLFFFLSVFLGSQGLYDAFGMEERSIYAGLLFFGLLYTPIELGLSLVLFAISRRHEYEADRWTVETVDDPGDLVTGLKKLSADNLTNLSPHPLLVAMEFTHPPLLQRVTAIENAMARKGGA